MMHSFPSIYDNVSWSVDRDSPKEFLEGPSVFCGALRDIPNHAQSSQYTVHITKGHGLFTGTSMSAFRAHCGHPRRSLELCGLEKNRLKKWTVFAIHMKTLSEAIQEDPIKLSASFGGSWGVFENNVFGFRVFLLCSFCCGSCSFHVVCVICSFRFVVVLICFAV